MNVAMRVSQRAVRIDKPSRLRAAAEVKALAAGGSFQRGALKRALTGTGALGGCALGARLAG
ncbi:hypothetical protein IV04_05010 [Serratia sp. Ag1]|nr:hypothetical protein JV45_05130 [Serratia sp. Ag2]KFK99928.1 hypothetical protein IV04_05010 [Serratia sp. Ag1]